MPIDENKMQKNVKLFSKYKAISWDLLFYYSISLLFFMQAKGMSASEVLFTESFYTLSKFLLQIPMVLLIEKIGKRKSVILGNILVTSYVLIVILCQNITQLLIAQFLCAIGFVLKGTCEKNLLYDSLPRDEKRANSFSVVDGKATSRYYYLNAITAAVSGFLFVINPYLPMILSLFMCILATYLSTKFEEIQNTEHEIGIKEQIKDLKYGFRYIFKSKRLVCLILFAAIFSGLISLLSTMRSTLLEFIDTPEQYFGIIFAILEILCGISAKFQTRLHNRFRNKTLSVLGIPFTVSCIFAGFIAMFDMGFSIKLGFIFLIFAVQFIARGPYDVLIDRYLNNFAHTQMRNRIASVKLLVTSLVTFALKALCSVLLGISSAAVTFILFGSISTIVMILLLDYMRTRVGLKPEQYKRDDIIFTELK